MSTPSESNQTVKLTKKDYESDQDVRWCPGCGDYAILAQVQKTIAEIDHPKEKHVFVSGIGCSSRFPYYMNTYGIHTIHGRAPAFATGIRIANPELKVWLVTGDGDGLSIGGNHMLHLCRRNVDVNLMLFNNEIYGLTKGQYSPTSPVGQVTKSTPFGSLDHPINPMAFVLGADVTFAARSTDRDLKHLSQMIHAADEHRGTSFLEVLQNCIVYNDGAFSKYTEKATKADSIVYLEAGKPLIFGKNSDKGIRLNPKEFKAEVVSLDSVPASELIVHDPSNRVQAFVLAQLQTPLPMGVLLDVLRPVYEHDLVAREENIIAERKTGDLDQLYRSAQTWVVQ